MKIAVVDHVGNHGGGSRVVRSLLPALKRLDPQLELTYFGNPAAIRRENMREEFAGHGIRVCHLASLRLANSALFKAPYVRRVFELVQSRWLKGCRWLPEFVSGNVVREIERRCQGFDLVFYPWPFLMACPRLASPAVGIFHDFNYKYYFSGTFVFSPAQRAQLEQEMPDWLDRTTPVVSTRFMAEELAAFYPQAAARTRVIPLAPLGGVAPVPTEQAQAVVQQLGVRSPFLLYPTHMCSHKNVGPLVAALALLRERHPGLSLVLTGAGTEAVRGWAHEIGVRLDATGGDVLGLGYVSNLQMDSLVQCAAVVVSPSLYEAGNGPGLDAWGRGTPVAMSDIPAFREHLSTLDVRARLFDPRSPQDIAAKIGAILDAPEQARADALHSREAMQRRTWDDTAAGYLKVFHDTLQAAGKAAA